ncbi:zinc transporter ZntB [Novosphingobium album (ex Liu et al. 2023)]|uniref:Zinc transporter ZntB n=1 Tax=Novosphingobium album (ex Liu et al. 2023) TaxID=3031130 RepID=A0ABT5WM12_9SPHN|nr:zinc transporter ZntB [Novosphingobium album (ex Liu et al. 2023)]MDE8651076.1 zinc transporter ZntB [Novosphingobium album (ex Liu et al. 2023)]
MSDPSLTDEADKQGPLLFGRVLDGEGGGRPISWDEVDSWRPVVDSEVLWIHLDRTWPGLAEWLEETLVIPEPTAELLTSDQTRPRAFREQDAIVATLRAINFNAGAEPEDMVSMQLWCDGRRLVTLRRLPLQTPRTICLEIDEGIGPLDAGSLITSLTEHLIDQMNHAIVDMNMAIDELEDIEDHTETGHMLARITTIRRNCLALKRHMSPQHEALEKIASTAPPWFESHDRREIAESIDRLARCLDDLDISKESALVLQDDIRARALAGSSRTQYLLTIVAAIFLPLTFLTGLLGINVGGIPGATHHSAFWIVALICAAILGVQLALFRYWKWF